MLIVKYVANSQQDFLMLIEESERYTLNHYESDLSDQELVV